MSFETQQEHCTDCTMPEGTRCESAPGSCPYAGKAAQDTLRRAFNNIVAAVAKESAAPCSSQTHRDAAIVMLKSLLPEWKPWDAESAEIVADAEEHIAMLTGCRKP